MTFLTEPLLLGLGSGVACLGSCGPLLLPWLASEARGARGSASLVARFLGGRLLGYLAFALPAWAWGWALARIPAAAPWFYAFAHLAVAAALAAYALPFLGRDGHRSCALAGRPWPARPEALGLLTGLNLCPPFLAALLRAGTGVSLAHALAFFFLFFLGTLPWFLPFLGAGALRRIPGLVQVARFVLLLLAAWYAYLGILLLLGRLSHGH